MKGIWLAHFVVCVTCFLCVPSQGLKSQGLNGTDVNGTTDMGWTLTNSSELQTHAQNVTIPVLHLDVETREDDPAEREKKVPVVGTNSTSAQPLPSTSLPELITEIKRSSTTTLYTTSATTNTTLVPTTTKTTTTSTQTTRTPTTKIMVIPVASTSSRTQSSTALTRSIPSTAQLSSTSTTLPADDTVETSCPDSCRCTPENRVNCSDISMDQILHLPATTSRLLIDNSALADLARVDQPKHASVFRRFHQLTDLVLRDCGIKQLHYTLLYDMKLMTIDLSYNKLTELEYYSQDRRSLRRLYVSHNQIRRIAENALEKLENLAVLDLSYNQLIALPASTHIGDLVGLTWLDFSHNRDERSQLGADFDVQSNGLSNLQLLFRRMNWLETLNLSDLGMVSLQVDQFARLNNLHTLNLSGNSFSSVRQSGVQRLRSIWTLDLSRNDIRDVSAAVMRHLDSTGMHSIDLSHNSFYCYCRLYPFTLWANSTGVNVKNYSSYMCARQAQSNRRPFSLKEYMHHATANGLCPDVGARSDAQASSSGGALRAVGITILIFIVIGTIVALAFYRFRLCSRWKSWRAKIRYKGVENGRERLGDAVELEEL